MTLWSRIGPGTILFMLYLLDLIYTLWVLYNDAKTGDVHPSATHGLTSSPIKKHDIELNKHGES